MKMFVAGPVNVSNAVKNSTVYDEIGHREPEFEKVYKSIKKSLKIVFGADDSYDSVVIGGSGTAGIETVLNSILRNNDKTIVISNGAFGERIADICLLHNKKILHVKQKWCEYPNIEYIEHLLKTGNGDYKNVIMVHMETSTGMLNPIHEIGMLCKQYDKTFIVDAVSSLGGEKLSMIDDNISFCITNTNKCLGGLPVQSIVCYSKQKISNLIDIKPTSYYLDLFKYIKYGEENQTPFTPAIPLFYMLDTTLKELIKEGLKNRQFRYQENGLLLKQRLTSIGFDFQLEDNMSSLMVNLYIPKELTYDKLSKKLRALNYICYPYKKESKQDIIHIANIGTLDIDDVHLFCDHMEDILRDTIKS